MKGGFYINKKSASKGGGGAIFSEERIVWNKERGVRNTRVQPSFRKTEDIKVVARNKKGNFITFIGKALTVEKGNTDTIYKIFHRGKGHIGVGRSGRFGRRGEGC